jgi:hypothetical protein
MEFNTFVSKLFHRYPQSEKLANPLDDPFYYDEFGTIKGYEKLRDNKRELAKSIESEQVLLAKIHSMNGDTTDEQKRIQKLETDILQLKHQIALESYFAVGEHIQIAKTVVALNKILTPVVFSLPNTKETKHIVQLAQKYLPILDRIDNNLNKFADIRNEKDEKLK